MTEIKKAQADKKITNLVDIHNVYTGSDACKIGIEVEQSFFNQDNLTPLTEKQCAAIIAKARTKSIEIHNEPSATSLELVSGPYLPNQLPALLKAIDHDFHALISIAKKQGITPSPFGHLPHTQTSDHNLIKNERYETFFSPPRDDMKKTFEAFVNYMNIQASASYKDANHLLKIIRMATALEPILFLSTESSCGFYENVPLKQCLGIELITKRGRNGGIPDFYYTAKTGDELINNHIDFTFNHPHIFAYFNNEGDLTRLPSDKWASFNELENRDLGPKNLTNYMQTQSESWRRACNIAPIINNDGDLISHRAELAAFQTGLMHQRATATLITNFIAFDEDFYEQTQALLLEHGIDLNDLQSCKALLNNNFEQACYHKNKYHSIPFGNGKTFKDFVTPFASIIESAADRSNLSQYARPAVHIMRSGRPDWLVYREAFQTLEETKNYMRNFERYIIDNPGLISSQECADRIIPSL